MVETSKVDSRQSFPDTSVAEVRPGYYRFVIEGILFFTYVVFGLTWSAAGAFLKEIMEQMDLSLSRAGFINTSVSLAKIFGPAAAGLLLGGLGLKRAFLLASGLICMGVLAPFATSFTTLLLARFAMGLGGALVVVYFTPLVMEWFEPGEREWVNGMNYVSISLGMMLGLIVTRPLMAACGGSWKSVLFIYSMLSVVLFVAWAVFGRESLRGQDSCAHGDPQRLAPEPGVRRPQDHLCFRILLDANAWKMVFTYGGLLSLYLVIITYLPTFYRVSDRFATGSAVHVAPSLVMFAGIPATIMGIWLSRKTGLRVPCVRISGMLLIPGALGLFVFQNTAVVLVSAVVCGFGMFLWRSAFFTIPQELPGNTTRRAGYMMGLFWSASYIIATVNTYLVGVIVEFTGVYQWGLYYITIVSSSMLIGSFILPETGPGRRR